MLTERLLAAQTYRDFLKIWVEQKGRKVNFSALSRKAGFSSRSFIKEVIEAKRGVTNLSLPKIVKAFDLVGSEKRFFECLFALEEPGVEVGLKNREQARLEIEKIRQKWFRGTRRGASDASSSWAFKVRHLGEVYAALGDLNTGSSLDEIQSRTGLPEITCREVVDFLISKGGATKKNERFFALQSQVDLFGMGQDESFKLQYLEGLSLLQRQARKNLVSDEEFYFHSMVSIRRSRLPAFKAQLRDLVLNFLDDVQEDDGDKVAKLTLGFHL